MMEIELELTSNSKDVTEILGISVSKEITGIRIWNEGVRNRVGKW